MHFFAALLQCATRSATAFSLVLLFSSIARADHIPDLKERSQLISDNFHCTVYFTPREEGYTSRNGFRTEPVSLPGIPGRTFPRDFVKIVRTEGFGRLKRPIGGKQYISSLAGGRWKLESKPVGRRMNPLVPLQSCAISIEGSRLRPGDWILIKSDRLPRALTEQPWRVDDVGAGVGRNQVDLYWGEDVSLDAKGSFYDPAKMPISRKSQIAIYRLPRQETIVASAKPDSKTAMD
jgi:hypothetical protein